MKETPASAASIPIGLITHEDTIYLYSHRIENNTISFQLETSKDGHSFLPAEEPKLYDRNGTILSTRKITGLAISKTKNKFALTYLYKPNKNTHVCIAFSDDLVHWNKSGKLHDIDAPGYIVSSSKLKQTYLLFYGNTAVNIAESKNLQKWHTVKDAVLPSTYNFFGTQNRRIAQITSTQSHFIIYYYNYLQKEHFTHYALHVVQAKKKDPTNILWETDRLLWETPRNWLRRKTYPVGVVETKHAVLSYWYVSGEMYVKSHSFSIEETKKARSFLKTFQFLSKLEHNPIIKPIAKHFWESRATFNPAAISDDDKIYIVYRAIGHDDVSTLGCAISTDGVTIDQRLPEPIYVPTEPFETGSHTPYQKEGKYTSGGGCYGGCEDPRITKIGNRFYMTYVAYNGSTQPRIALTSIRVEDFRNHQFDKWEKPVLISKPGEVNKNACIFPEKINGKYGIFHRVFPNILIDFVDSLDFDGKTKFLEGMHKIEPRLHTWDSRKVGAGPPPIKTKDGWLLIYQAVDDRYDKEYKIGAMILDTNNPTHIKYRPNRPVLEPRNWYENEGFKSGVVYPCGAVTKNNQLFVYYGGADTYTNVAVADLDIFLEEIKANEPAHLHLQA